MEEEDELKARGKVIFLCNSALYGTAHFFSKLCKVKISKSGDERNSTDDNYKKKEF